MPSLIQQLVNKGLIDKERAKSLELEVRKSDKKEEDIVLESGAAPESVLFELKSENLGIPLKEIGEEQISLKALGLIPEETAKYYQMIPLTKTDKGLEIGMVYPEDLKAQEALKFLSRQGKFNYKVFLITPTTFKSLLRQYRTFKKEVGRALDELETELTDDGRGPQEKTAYERVVEEAPVIKIVAVILRHAVEGLASDIHIEPTKEKVRVRFRLTGQLHSSIFLPLDTLPAIISRIKILSNLKIDETRVPQDGRFSTTIDGKTIDFRVSTLPTSLGEKVAIRVLDPATGLKSFEDLGLVGRNLEILKKGISRSYGLILVTGPTGSGKSTTLYAVLQSLNKEGVNIVTLEDPVEYFIEGVNQSQVRPEVNYDFSVGLRHVVRQDPDIIMVGEVRDEETANLVIHAALTGHIVLSTLHTSNALGVIPRLIDMGVKPYLIPSTLRLAIAQRLIRKLCSECKKQIIPRPEIKILIEKELASLSPDVKGKIAKPLKIYTAPGCPKCNDTGFSGRIALFEILSMTDEISDIILKEPSESAIRKEADKQGMITMRQDGILKVLNGTTTIEEVLRASEEY